MWFAKISNTTQRAGAGAELVSFDAQVLKHGNEEVRHWRVADGVEGKMLTVFEAAAGEDEGEVLVAVGVGVAEAASIKHLRVIEQRAAGFGDVAEGFEEIGEGLHLGFFDLLQFGNLVGFVAVMGEAVRFAFHAGHVWHDAEGAERERDDARAVGLQGEADEVEHEFGACDDLVGIGDVFGLRVVHFGLRTVFPLDVALEAVFEFAHALEVLIESGTVFGGAAFFESPGFVEDQVEHAASGLDSAHGGGFFFRCACDKKPAVELLGTLFRWKHDTRAGDGDGVTIVLALAHGNGERGEACVESEFLCSELIEGEAVAKRRLPRMRRAAEEALARVVVAIHVWVREAVEGGEMRSLLGKEIQVGAGSLACLREEKLRHHAQRYMNGEKPFRRKFLSRTTDGRQSEQSASSAEEVSAVHRLGRQ